MNRKTKLRIAIKSALENITKANSPNIFGMIYNKKGKVSPRGYQIIEAKVIKKIINNNLNISSAIPQLEMEMDLR